MYIFYWMLLWTHFIIWLYNIKLQNLCKYARPTDYPDELFLFDRYKYQTFSENRKLVIDCYALWWHQFCKPLIITEYRFLQYTEECLHTSSKMILYKRILCFHINGNLEDQFHHYKNYLFESVTLLLYTYRLLFPHSSMIYLSKQWKQGNCFPW